jgi:hypothetical protein
VQITAERAFWILDFYRRHGTPLSFSARNPDEESREAYVSDVSTVGHAIAIKLLSRELDHVSDRVISLRRAAFSLLQMGDVEFERFVNPPFHSILIFDFPDGKRMGLAE